jgi:hypothetical protein
VIGVGSDKHVINLASDRRLGIVEIGQKVWEGNRTIGGGKPRAPFPPTFHGTYRDLSIRC